MPPTPQEKECKKVKTKEYKLKAFLVIGSLGTTAAYKLEIRAEKEKKRIERVGYNASIVPCVITYSLKK